MTDEPSRREFVRTTAALGAVGVTGALAGCSGGGDDTGGTDMDGTDTGDGSTSTGDGGTSVSVGPNGELVFDSEEVTVGVGETVTWEFESAGHNVSAYPDQADVISVPDDAEPFGSDGVAEDQYATMSQGETFEHTFETAGEYTYACIPHVGSDMVGTVVVEE